MDDLQSNLGRWVLPLVTAMIAWGGYPSPPQAFVMLTDYELFRYALLFILIWQGGGQQDLKTSLIATAIIYFVTKILEVRQMINDLNMPLSQAPMQMLPSMSAQTQTPPLEALNEVSVEQAMQQEASVENFYHYR